MSKGSVWLISSAVLALALLVVQVPMGMVAAEDVRFGEYAITGPHTHDNLSVFLICGKNKVEGKEFLTLEEALDKKVAMVHETEDVEELLIDNYDPKIYIYIQQGDIVKGGKQDRVLSFDVVVPPKAKKFRIKSFCVEQGRWNRRGAESSAYFSMSGKQVAGKKLKAMSNVAVGRQAQVWDNVKEVQAKLASKAELDVSRLGSQSSLQLTLEAGTVDKAAKAYTKALSGAPGGKKDVVGFAFVINGKVSSANVYASNVLSEKLWSKLLEASAVEAVAEKEKEKDGTFQPAAAKDVKTWLENAEKGARTATAVNAKLKVVKQETDAAYILQTEGPAVDLDAEAAENRSIHRSYISK